MKNIKIFLSVVAVFTIVGNALAYKAALTQFIFVHDPVDPRISACTKQNFLATLTKNPDLISITRASIASTTTGCPLVPIYKGE